VKIWFSASQARYIRERQWAQEQKITKQKDGSIVLWMKTSGWYDVKKWVLSFGAEACLLEPKHLQDKIRNEVEKMCKGYGGAAQ
jgi:predicted DNA-binding transcriptional regulator YafY